MFIMTFEVMFIRMFIQIYQNVIFIIVKDNSEYFIYYEVCMYQKVISCYY